MHLTRKCANDSLQLPPIILLDLLEHIEVQAVQEVWQNRQAVFVQLQLVGGTHSVAAEKVKHSGKNASSSDTKLIIATKSTSKLIIDSNSGTNLILIPALNLFRYLYQ